MTFTHRRTHWRTASIRQGRPAASEYFQKSEFLEDVFTIMILVGPLKPPNHPRYLNTEFVGHTYPVKTTT